MVLCPAPGISSDSCESLPKRTATGHNSGRRLDEGVHHGRADQDRRTDVGRRRPGNERRGARRRAHRHPRGRRPLRRARGVEGRRRRRGSHLRADVVGRLGHPQRGWDDHRHGPLRGLPRARRAAGRRRQLRLPGHRPRRGHRRRRNPHGRRPAPRTVGRTPGRTRRAGGDRARGRAGPPPAAPGGRGRLDRQRPGRHGHDGGSRLGPPPHHRGDRRHHVDGRLAPAHVHRRGHGAPLRVPRADERDRGRMRLRLHPRAPPGRRVGGRPVREAPGGPGGGPSGFDHRRGRRGPGPLGDPYFGRAGPRPPRRAPGRGRAHHVAGPRPARRHPFGLRPVDADHPRLHGGPRSDQRGRRGRAVHRRHPRQQDRPPPAHGGDRQHARRQGDARLGRLSGRRRGPRPHVREDDPHLRDHVLPRGHTPRIGRDGQARPAAARGDRARRRARPGNGRGSPGRRAPGRRPRLRHARRRGRLPGPD